MLESRAVKLGMQIAKVQQQEKNQRVFVSAAGVLKRQKECCRTLCERFITSMA
jgi:hypothetical protein